MLTREEFAKLTDEKYDKIRPLKDEPTLLDYERGFVKIWTESRLPSSGVQPGPRGK
jgi:hypothetical protein